MFELNVHIIRTRLATLLIGLLMFGVCHAFINKNTRLLNMQNGLADNNVTAIHQDNNGFLWFGTLYGLSRYDGERIKNFDLQTTPTSILNIEECFEDKLVVQKYNIVQLFDRKKERFLPTTNSKGHQLLATSILPKNDSLLWILNGNKLLLMRCGTTQNDTIRLEQKQSYGPWKHSGSQWITAQYSPDRKTICLVDNQANVLIVDADNPNQEILRTDFGYHYEIAINSVFYDEGQLWISTIQHGLLYYNLKTQKKIQLSYSSPNASHRMAHTDVYGIVRLTPNRYLAATWNGCNIINVDHKASNPITVEHKSNNFLPDQELETRMISIYYDRNGILWIGTDGGGIISTDLRSRFFNRYTQKRTNEICSILMDDEGYLWLSTFHQGILRSTEPFGVQKKNNFQEIPSRLVKERNTVLCSLKDSKGNLWFGNQNGSLTRYTPLSRHFEAVPLYNKAGIPNKSPVWFIFIDSKQRFWIGTQNGLIQFNPSTMQSHKIPLIEEGSTKPLYPYIRHIAESKDGSLWLGTGGNGVYRMIRPGIITRGYEKKARLNDYSVRSQFSASDGNFYVGYSTGFAIIHPEADSISAHYTTRDGLCNNFIGCITEDSLGQIWLGTKSGISRFSLQQHLFYNYYISGSNRSAYCFDNTLFFGNNKSLTYFNPTHIYTPDSTSRVVLTGIEVDNIPVEIGISINGQVVLEQGIYYTPSIKLSHANRDFALIFNNLFYSAERQKYHYRLLPYQTEWLVTDGDGKASYTNLPAGKYQFEVKNIYPNERNGKVTTLSIEILPHWSNTHLFYFCLALLALAALGVVVSYLQRKQKRLRHELQLEQEAFTATMERDKEKQIRIERDRFFTDAAHELRTPLTLILSPLQELLQSFKPTDAVYNKLYAIYNNGKSIHTLVDQLLYVQKIEAGMVKLRLTETDLTELASNIAETFKPLAESQHIHFHINLPTEPTNLWIDSEKIASALRNMLSNAFKYTPKNGSISLSGTHIEQDGLPMFKFIVSDTGKGIPTQLQEHIYESFVTGENTPLFSTRIGIGMRIIKNTADLHHGQVHLNSAPDKGTTISLVLPKGKEYFASDQYEILPTTFPSEKETFMIQMPTTSDETRTDTSGKQKSMLIVEDNADIRNYLFTLFKPQYNTYEAANGEEGLQIAINKAPDIIIMDVMMPIMDGFTCCNEIKQNPKIGHVPILLLTAKAEENDILHGAQIGADDYMMKPFNPLLLQAKVKSLIAQREQLKRIYTHTLMLNTHNQSSQDKTQHETESNDFINQIIHIIEAHITNRDFNVKMLADSLNMSQPTLYRKLKQHNLPDAIEIIRSVRISKAASLVITHKYSLQEITELVGYTDVRTLRKHFTNQFGVTPSKFNSQ